MTYKHLCWLFVPTGKHIKIYTLRDCRVSQAFCLGDTDVTNSIEKETRIGMKLRILGSLSLKPKKITTQGTQQRTAPTNMTACINAQVITYAIHQ